MLTPSRCRESDVITKDCRKSSQARLCSPVAHLVLRTLHTLSAHEAEGLGVAAYKKPAWH